MFNKSCITELLIKSGVYFASIIIVLKIFIPIISPAAKAADIDLTSEYFFEELINKSIPAVEQTMDVYEDENKKKLLTMVFNYVTGIDLSDPSTYLASQIPLLGLLHDKQPASGESGISSIQISQGDINQTGSGENKGTSSNPGVPSEPVLGQIDNENPVVFIYHTHTTECYNPALEKNKNFSTDLSTTVAAVGDMLEKKLEEVYGISTIHDKTVHDLPLRDEGYSKSRKTAKRFIEQYSSIKIVVDLHRDGDVPKDRATISIDGVDYARTMFVLSENDSVGSNAQVVNSMNAILDKMYPGFSRGISKSKYIYNQDLSDGCILVEVGSNTNEFQEAMNTADVLAKVIAEYMKGQ